MHAYLPTYLMNKTLIDMAITNTRVLRHTPKFFLSLFVLEKASCFKPVHKSKHRNYGLRLTLPITMIPTTHKKITYPKRKKKNTKKLEDKQVLRT